MVLETEYGNKEQTGNGLDKSWIFQMLWWKTSTVRQNREKHQLQSNNFEVTM